MAFFDKIRKGKEKAQPTGWDDMNNPNAGGNQHNNTEVISTDSERQKRKILGAFALGINGHINVDALNRHDTPINPATREAIIDKMASGQIGDAQKRELLSRILGPMQNIDNAGEVTRTLDTKHERRILAAMGAVGFDNWRSVTAGDMRAFIERYPTPMDFQHASDDFLNMIEGLNGAEKRAEYETAMRSFKMKVYGKKQEYWDRMLELDEEVDAARERHERERSSEWVPGDVGVWQVSRDQTQTGMVSRENIDRGLWANINCEDSFFSRPEQQLYGVFDGAGGMAGGRLASQITASVVREFSDKYVLRQGTSLAAVLEAANRRVAAEPSAGMSTASLASVVRSGNSVKLAYASVGDSRIYIVNKDGEAYQITNDEGEGRIISNAIGQAGVAGEPIVKQYGEVDLQRGDRVVICSDGITGDYGDDLMSNSEIGGIVRNSHGALDASKNLLTAARKFDDRTAIVFVPDFDKI